MAEKSNAPRPESGRSGPARFFIRNLPRLLVAVLLLVIVLLALLMGEEKKRLQRERENTPAPERPPVNVVVLTMHPTTIRDLIRLPAEMEAWEELVVSARVAGTIDMVRVREGERVDKGALLARIEEGDFRIARDRARAAFDFAAAEHERAKTMFGDGVISVAELEAAGTSLRTAGADLDNSELQLSRCAITAPLTGVVKKMFAKPGLFVGIGDPVAEIVRIDRLKAVVGIPESDVTAVTGIDEVGLTIKALGSLRVMGRKHFLAPAPEDRAHLYRLELEVDNTAGKILPGMFARAEIVRQTVTDALVLPLHAVISEQGRHLVYLDIDGTAQRREVEPGFLEGWKVLVKSGLHPGDRVLVEGQRSVENGRPIHVLRELGGLDEIRP